jgi:hypothetical protein
MEKVKFRAWSKQYKKLVYFDFSDIVDERVIFGNDHTLNVMENEVERFTGLTDKNGVEAYDQDIYKNGESGLIGLFHIEESIGGYILFCTEYKNGQIHTHIPFIELDLTDFEVIGNIHKDKHLLD